MKKTNFEIESQFWVIARHGDPKGYHTGTKHMETSLFEFDSATELNEFLGDKSVESGESMGDYVFRELGCSHTNFNLNQLEDYEKQEKDNEELERKYMEEESKRWSE